MTILSIMQADAAAILLEIGVPIVVRLEGVIVKTVTGGYYAEVDTLNSYQVERAVPRPMVVLSAADASGITRNHTLQPEGLAESRIYGDPRPGGAGMVQFFLVK